MTTDAHTLLEQARAVAENAYAPYSNFRVGAVVVASDASVHVGSNIENAAFGASVCAEVNAITSAAALGVRTIDTVAVVCLDGEPCTPCGNCRQVMREFEVKRIILCNGDDDPLELTLEDLLPRSFGPEALS